jgi:hypothetical protein
MINLKVTSILLGVKKEHKAVPFKITKIPLVFSLRAFTVIGALFSKF